MQRMPTGLHRQLDDEWVIDFPKFQSSSSSPSRSVDAESSSADQSPQHRLVQIISGRRDARRSWIKENWVHAIPLVVLISLFILWWFSSPVEISIKQGVAEALWMVIQTNNTADQKVELAILASSALTPLSTTSPIAWTGAQAKKNL